MSIIDAGFVYIEMADVALLIQDLADLAGELGGYEEPLRRSVEQVVAPSIRQNFEQGGRPHWPDLSPETLLIRAQEGSGSQILVRSGALMEAASDPSIWTIDDDSASVEGLPESVYYGNVHQEGSDFIPARPFLMIQPQDEDQIVNVFDTWLGEKLSAF